MSPSCARGRSASRGRGEDEKEKWIVRPKVRVVRHPSDEFIPRPSPTTPSKLTWMPTLYENSLTHGTNKPLSFRKNLNTAVENKWIIVVLLGGR